jgi:hypothetical protein
LKSLNVFNGAIGLVEKKEEEREGRRRSFSWPWRTESTAHRGPLSEVKNA